VRRAAGTALLGACLCLLAPAFGVPALLVPGVALVLAAAGALCTVRLVPWRSRISREPLAATIEEGQQVRLAVRISGPRPLRHSGELAAIAGSPFEPRRWLGREGRQVAVTATRRGEHVIAPSLLRFRDPFGLCSQTLESSPTQLLVLPRIERIARSDLARLSELSQGAARPLASAAGEFDGLQAAASGAPASRIHWPSLAKTGTLMERRLRAEVDSLPLVVLDGHEPAAAEEFDMAVRAAASLAVALARAGGCSLLLPAEPRAHPLDATLESWPRIHARLALQEPSRALSWAAIERARVILWVTASAAADVLVRSRGACAYVVSPFPRAEREVLFSVAGCALQRAGVARRERAA